MKNAFLWSRRAAWRACPALLVLIVAFAPLGCKRKRGADEQPLRLAPVVRMGDPRAGPQLLKGFYGIEAGAWRWTARRFSVILLPPAGAAQNGASLEFRLTVPDSVIAKLGRISLSASIGGQAFPSATYSKTGDYAYTADVPAALLGGESVEVDFQLDGAMPPNPPELRELGVVAQSVELQTKTAK
ncbi:MAG: hypothetical protein ABSC23_00300 [Bryobacteraceae bacterium]|jgi:hypothetical protein